MKIPFAVRYIKLVVECFESYHSHFDELGPQNRSSGKRVFRVPSSSALSACLINNRPRPPRGKERRGEEARRGRERRGTGTTTNIVFTARVSARLLEENRPIAAELSETDGNWLAERRGEERDPIVKLVVACCFSGFHITAIFDDLDRRFLRRSRLRIRPRIPGRSGGKAGRTL